ncbi:MAG: glycosyltransferase family 39 protein [Chloroflexota bacterium]|nr:glycosyltransferase family 39 protein [Chloroflexota bacterium]
MPWHREPPMLQTAFAWLLIALLVPSAYPLARRLLAYSPVNDGPILTWMLALALGPGILTLIMLWLGLLAVAFDVAIIVVAYVAVLGIGYWVLGISYQLSVISHSGPELEVENQELRTPSSSFIAVYLLLAAIAIAVLFNAAWWPFSRDDAVGVYHPQAQLMSRTGALLPISETSLHDAYPMLIPLSYTFSYMASGWDNEYLARIIPALLALGCIPTAWLLARRMAGEQAGAVAAFILAITPVFGSWASHGYTDLPVGFYYALSAVFAMRLWQSGAMVDALLASVCMGMAAWTKNSALIGVGALGVWLLWARANRRINWQYMSGCVAVIGTIASPWYVRNLLAAGFLLPDTAWVDQAQPTLVNLLIYVTLPDNYGISGVLLLTGIAWGLWRAFRQPRTAVVEVVTVVWFVPFFGAWWLLASYDPRFLVSVLPITAALGGGVAMAAWRGMAANIRRRLRIVLLVIAIGLTAITVWRVVEFKAELLRNPLMSDAEKQAVVTER